MTITITFDDSVSKNLLQNIALARGLNDVTDDQVREHLGQMIGKQLGDLAINGDTIRLRLESEAPIREAVAKISVS